MKVELLSIYGKWEEVAYKSTKELLEIYSNAIFVTDTDEHDYYASNDKWKVLFRLTKPKPMTIKEAEQKYGIKIEG